MIFLHSYFQSIIIGLFRLKDISWCQPSTLNKLGSQQENLYNNMFTNDYESYIL